MGVPQPERLPSLWSLKPWWCQPWSILLTGMVVVAASWLLVGRWWLSLVVATGVGAWWMLFLVLVPAAYRAEALQAQAAPATGCISPPPGVESSSSLPEVPPSMAASTTPAPPSTQPTRPNPPA
jgi:hypothetical protein